MPAKKFQRQETPSTPRQKAKGQGPFALAQEEKRFAPGANLSGAGTKMAPLLQVRPRTGGSNNLESPWGLGLINSGLLGPFLHSVNVDRNLICPAQQRPAEFFASTRSVSRPVFLETNTIPSAPGKHCLSAHWHICLPNVLLVCRLWLRMLSARICVQAWFPTSQKSLLWREVLGKAGAFVWKHSESCLHARGACGMRKRPRVPQVLKGNLARLKAARRKRGRRVGP